MISENETDSNSLSGANWWFLEEPLYRPTCIILTFILRHFFSILFHVILKERHRTKQLLASQELLFPHLYSSLQTALKPLMAKNKTGMESSLYSKNSKKQQLLNGSVDDDEDEV